MHKLYKVSILVLFDLIYGISFIAVEKFIALTLPKIS